MLLLLVLDTPGMFREALGNMPQDDLAVTLLDEDDFYRPGEGGYHPSAYARRKTREANTAMYDCVIIGPPKAPPQEDAPYCFLCGIQMMRAGSCHACPSCGATSGCG